MKFVPPLVPPFVDGTSKVWHACAPVRRRVIFCGRGGCHYFLTIKFMRLRKPIVRSLGFEGCSDFKAPLFIWGLPLNPNWNSLSKSSRSCAVISELFCRPLKSWAAAFHYPTCKWLLIDKIVYLATQYSHELCTGVGTLKQSNRMGLESAKEIHFVKLWIIEGGGKNFEY